jgi:hypothetical protein
MPCQHFFPPQNLNYENPHHLGLLLFLGGGILVVICRVDGSHERLFDFFNNLWFGFFLKEIGIRSKETSGSQISQEL